MSGIDPKKLRGIVRQFVGLPDREKWIVAWVEALIENPQTQFGLQRAQVAAATEGRVRRLHPAWTKQRIAREMAEGALGRVIGLNTELDDKALAKALYRLKLRLAQKV